MDGAIDVDPDGDEFPEPYQISAFRGFPAPTLGAGAWILAVFERMPGQATRWLVIFGSAPLFFYMLHLYGLHILNRMAALVWPTSDSGLVSVPTIGAIWLLAATVAIPCWFACRWFARCKRASDRWWMRYL